MKQKKPNKKGQGFKINHLLSDPDKLVSDAENLLAALFRVYLGDANIGPELYIRLVTNWLNDPRYGIHRNPSVKSYARGNLDKEILRPNMSATVFLKAMSVMDVEDLELVLRVRQRGRDNYTEHTIEFNNLPDIVSSRLKNSGASNDDNDDDGKSEGEPTGYRRKKKDAGTIK